MRREALLPLLALTAMTALACAREADESASPDRRGRQLAVEEVMGGEIEGFAIADGSEPIRFPRDHGPHPDFRTEWWYLTGNLSDGERELGYQLTIFRSALTAEPLDSPSNWASRQLYMGHLAVGDFGTGRFRARDRFARGALGLAGAQLDPFRVWIEDWVLEGPESPSSAGPLDALLPLRLRAGEGDVELELRLERDRPLVLQGVDGLSRKGSRPENASYYYSVTRMRTSGSVTIEGREHRVEGLSWLDREWSTSALESGQEGWDWFALQLSDGTDLMLYVMRRRDGTVDPNSNGVLVGPDGPVARLSAEDYTITSRSTWTSPATGIRYPSGWRLRVPSLDIDLEVEPKMANQELDLAFRYWEGAVVVRGRGRSGAVTGSGYVELTGYAEGGV